MVHVQEKERADVNFRSHVARPGRVGCVTSAAKPVRYDPDSCPQASPPSGSNSSSAILPSPSSKNGPRGGRSSTRTSSMPSVPSSKPWTLSSPNSTMLLLPLLLLLPTPTLRPTPRAVHGLPLYVQLDDNFSLFLLSKSLSLPSCLVALPSPAMRPNSAHGERMYGRTGKRSSAPPVHSPGSPASTLRPERRRYQAT
jgi:hypothetical protein